MAAPENLRSPSPAWSGRRKTAPSSALVEQLSHSKLMVRRNSADERYTTVGICAMAKKVSLKLSSSQYGCMGRISAPPTIQPRFSALAVPELPGCPGRRHESLRVSISNNTIDQNFTRAMPRLTWVWNRQWFSTGCLSNCARGQLQNNH